MADHDDGKKPTRQEELETQVRQQGALITKQQKAINAAIEYIRLFNGQSDLKNLIVETFVKSQQLNN